MKTILISILLALSLSAQSKTTPQYVMLAFDGSYSLEMWKETLDFSKKMQSKGADIKFTYFISGVYFLNNKNKQNYLSPLGSGRSNIGFASSLDDIDKRLTYLNKAVEDGHEIGSHANGHFDGSNWSQRDWDREFKFFNDLIFNSSNYNKKEMVELIFNQDDVKGFRAPLLGHSPGLWPVLNKYNFTYDTSRTSSPSYWPKKISNVWNFPLAEIKIVGTWKSTLSMDYNFYVNQSRGKPAKSRFSKKWKEKKLKKYKKQMYDSYMKYFNDNYNGNRAPLHIGHHFSKWNKGIYWEALKEFAKSVCSKKDVKCVTYNELVSYMEEGKAPKSKTSSQVSSSSKSLISYSSNKIELKSKKITSNMTVSLEVNGKEVSHTSINTNSLSKDELSKGVIFSYSVKEKEEELYRETRVIFDKDQSTQISKKSFEQWMLKGDSHGAHRNDYSLINEYRNFVRNNERD